MSLANLAAVLKEGHPPIVLVLSDEDLLLQQAAAMVEQAALGPGAASFNRDRFRADEDGATEALTVARTVPMLAARRFVHLQGTHVAPRPVLEALAAYAASPSPSTVLLVTGARWPKSSAPDWGRRSEAAIKKTGKVFRLKQKDVDPRRFAIDTARELGCSLGSREARMLIERVGSDLGCLRRELEKVALYMGGSGPVREEVLIEVCSALGEQQVWALTDALLKGDAASALAACQRLLDDSDNSHNPHVLLSMISWQVRQLLQLQSCLAGGRDPAGAGLRVPRFKLDNMTRALRRRPLAPATILRRLADANLAMNSHRAGDRRSFEGLVLRLVSDA